MISQNPDDSGWFRMISCLIIRPPRMILQKISGHFCQFWNPRARMMASNFRRNFVKLWPAVYPPRMAPFGLKLWENPFQTIPDISFFDVAKKNWRKFSIKNFIKKIFVGKLTNCLFLRSYGFLDVIGRCASKSYPQSFDFQLSTTFGGGVKEIVSIFSRLSAKNDFNPFRFLARRHMCPGW